MHILSLVNREDKFWINIFHNKYLHWNPSTQGSHSNTSNFFKAICKVSNVLKSHLHLSVCNPTITNFWDDPWFLDLPFRFKPTFINMELTENLSINQIAPYGNINFDACLVAFGNNLDRDTLNCISFDLSSKNEWIWWPHSSKPTLVAAVYDHLNSVNNPQTWKSWRHLWKLKVPPRVKTFLYRLNIGPATMCNFCGLFPETADHILWNYRNTFDYWHTVLNGLGLNPSLLNQLDTGNWLTNNIECWASCDFAKSVITTTTWHIWTARCMLIFQHINPIFSKIPMLAWTSTSDFFAANNINNRENPIHSLSNHMNIYISTDASWDPISRHGGFGYLIYTKS
ncbi:hypothetical protein IHE45_11G034400 [Dioscorea alata]|uniref:Uncharacterized protein n=1 Tax=Dioscorea alata TaxID=55571 RepID=A0ACB7V5S8_DIOAL|nr:hypothetical protein IHE45_11G034400 [Dioscorea alata]